MAAAVVLDAAGFTRSHDDVYGISIAQVFNNIMGRALTKFNVAPSTPPPVAAPGVLRARVGSSRNNYGGIS